ncbi:MAG TPA: DUF2085 domain-containing protein [Chloroflexota bacterium]|nr:DUF2085 domain-containing protein [Chloroflexota bacterium]
MARPAVHPSVSPFSLLSLVALPALALGGLLLAPGSADARFAAILHGICAQRASHSIVAGGQPMALEARMDGIFVGFVAAVVVVWLAGGARRTALPSGWALAVLLAGIGAMGVDGANALMFDTGGPWLYAPRIDLRLATGLLCGVSVAAFIAPSISHMLWREREPAPFFTSWRDVAMVGVVVGALGFATLTVAVPITVLSAVAVLSVLFAFWIANAHVCVLAWAGTADAEGWRDLAGYGAMGFVLAAVELVALSALRDWMEAALHVTWVA